MRGDVKKWLVYIYTKEEICMERDNGKEIVKKHISKPWTKPSIKMMIGGFENVKEKD